MTDLPAPSSALHPDRSEAGGTGGGAQKDMAGDLGARRRSQGTIGVATGAVTSTNLPAQISPKAAESHRREEEVEKQPSAALLKSIQGNWCPQWPPPIIPTAQVSD